MTFHFEIFLGFFFFFDFFFFFLLFFPAWGGATYKTKRELHFRPNNAFPSAPDHCWQLGTYPKEKGMVSLTWNYCFPLAIKTDWRRKKKKSKQSNTNNAPFSLRRHCCFREVGGGVCSGVPALWHGVPCRALGFLSKSCMLLLQCLPCPAPLLWCLLFPSPILFPLSFSSPPAPPPLHLYQQLMKQAGRNPIRTVIKFT